MTKPNRSLETAMSAIDMADSDVEALQAKTDSLIQMQTAQERGHVRSRVTLVVIWGYVVLLAAIVLYLVFRAPDSTDVPNLLLELVKVAALPVVTFVIGHYFGSNSS